MVQIGVALALGVQDKMRTSYPSHSLQPGNGKSFTNEPSTPCNTKQLDLNGDDPNKKCFDCMKKNPDLILERCVRCGRLVCCEHGYPNNDGTVRCLVRCGDVI